MTITKNIIRFYFPLAVAIIFVALGVRGILAYQTHRAAELRNNALQREVQLADSLTDQHEAVNRYKKTRPQLPEIQLRILTRQWSMALERLHQIRAAQSSQMLKKDIPGLLDNLKTHLDEMNDRCGALLIYGESGATDQPSDIPEGWEVSKPDADMIWRAYTIRGAIRLVMAFVTSEWERNPKKAAGMMRQAISDFKTAVEQVDQSGAAAFEKQIPRWNLEILHGEQYMKKITFTQTDAEQRLKLRENLEAIIPEKGGYAPGEPLERKVRK